MSSQQPAGAHAGETEAARLVAAVIGGARTCANLTPKARAGTGLPSLGSERLTQSKESVLHRRDLITSAVCALAAGPVLAASWLRGLDSLPRATTMPVLFVGHGSPMNVIQDSPRRWGGVEAP